MGERGGEAEGTKGEAGGELIIRGGREGGRTGGGGRLSVGVAGGEGGEVESMGESFDKSRDGVPEGEEPAGERGGTATGGGGQVGEKAGEQSVWEEGEVGGARPGV